MKAQSAIQSEFDLIRRYFAGLTRSREDVSLGIGDDAALLNVPPGMELVVSIDTLVEGVHFFPDVSPAALGHKVLAVNLSDLAAMGAEPAWITLALTLPKVDESWLTQFSRGFEALAGRHGVALVGGDTTRGPLSITVQAHGWVPAGAALRRGGARDGDELYVTGTLGDAALYLASRNFNLSEQRLFDSLRERLERPQPRVEAGLALRGIASSAIDISDGLIADLGHILAASGMGATISLDRIPLSMEMAQWQRKSGDWQTVLAGGDDYELCFSADRSQGKEITRISEELDLPISCIGMIESQSGLRITQPDGKLWSAPDRGFDHFSGESRFSMEGQNGET
ncbi:MAG: thiamine-phosphate kinase [Candidatus Thiodiazotropha sp. (ex Monitilora ramsayi)]|nr:thiamine-phosphate kinase [Candidatus Thiodiazotropha sp. (ex Monitilora ramsayi)]